MLFIAKSEIFPCIGMSIRVYLYTGRNTMQVHIFADTSSQGYSAVAYVRSQNMDNSFNLSFLLGKTRVAPLKSLSIPRLELIAAVLAISLSIVIKRETIFANCPFKFWSDSEAVLGYIQMGKIHNLECV